MRWAERWGDDEGGDDDEDEVDEAEGECF